MIRKMNNDNNNENLVWFQRLIVNYLRSSTNDSSKLHCTHSRVNHKKYEWPELTLISLMNYKLCKVDGWGKL